MVMASHEYKDTWIGGNDAQEESQWFWSDGTPFHHTIWCPGEPNNSRLQHCLYMNSGGKSCWDDCQCHYHKPFVCAKKAT